MIEQNEFLLSEIRELQQLIDGLPANATIRRRSLESRLKSIREELDQERNIARPSRVRLTFRGRPVVGSRGIAADFGGKASNAFADAFAAVVAGLNENLRSMGPIPDRSKNQLLITGTAIGSFGFEFELPASEGLFPEQEKTEDALQKMQSLLEASAVGSDDDVAEVVDAIHSRAVKKISEFLGILSQNHAWCGLEFKHKIFKFEGIEQLERSAGRLEEGNIREGQESHRGEFIGFLPTSRLFEFSTAEGVIRGKVGPLVDNPDIINKEWLRREVEIALDVVQVGQGRPRFKLNSLPTQ